MLDEKMAVRMMQADEEGEESFAEYLNSNFWLLAIILVAGLVALLLLVCIMREVCWSKYDVEVCPGAAGGYRQRQAREAALRQQEEDRQVAVELQAQLEREHQEVTLLQKRKERREKYSTYLEPYSMIVGPDHYCRATTAENVDATSGYDVEAQSVRTHDNYDHDMLILPATTFGRPARHVEAECAICITPYEQHDKVVWSSRKDCPHAFHDECILTWLSKGKKRCPICRHFFVPGVAIDGVKTIVDEETPPENEEVNSDAHLEHSDDDACDETEEDTMEAVQTSLHVATGAQDLVV